MDNTKPQPLFNPQLSQLQVIRENTDLKNISRTNILLRKRYEDEIFFKNYINNENTINMAEFRIKAKPLKFIIADLNTLSKQLRNLNNELRRSDLPKNNWLLKQQLCENLKKQIKHLQFEMIFNKIENPGRDLRKQKGSRNINKEKNKRWHSIKNYLNNKKYALGQKIDRWKEEKQNEVQKEKEEKSLHKDADIILSDVRAKRSDVKKFLIMLQELDNLRKVKVTMTKMGGGKISTEADQVFTNIIEKLILQWQVLNKEYFWEEKGLRLMIKANNQRQSPKFKKDIYLDWEITLFKNRVTNYLRKNLKNILKNRRIWDKFANDMESTSIPIGWVVPLNLRSSIWTKYIMK